MKYNIKNENGVVTINLSGDLTFQEHADWRTAMEQVLAKGERKHIVDLTNLATIDSAGLGMLLVMRDQSEKLDREMFIRLKKDGQVKSTLHLAQFEKMIPFCD